MKRISQEHCKQQTGEIISISFRISMVRIQREKCIVLMNQDTHVQVINIQRKLWVRMVTVEHIKPYVITLMAFLPLQLNHQVQRLPIRKMTLRQHSSMQLTNRHKILHLSQLNLKEKINLTITLGLYKITKRLISYQMSLI